jgi:hypothetical protein
MIEFIKSYWVWIILILLIIFVTIRTKIRGYFYKTKKGEKLKFKEFFKLWKRGINGITPIQTAKSQVMGNIIVLVGIISGIIINCLTRIENQWVWIVIVLSGSLIITSLNQVGYLQKYWRLKLIKDEINKLEKKKKR